MARKTPRILLLIAGLFVLVILSRWLTSQTELVIEDGISVAKCEELIKQINKTYDNPIRTMSDIHFGDFFIFSKKSKKLKVSQGQVSVRGVEDSEETVIKLNLYYEYDAPPRKIYYFTESDKFIEIKGIVID